MNALSHITADIAAEWATLRSAYQRALDVERAHDAATMPAPDHEFVSCEAETESDRLTDIRYGIEDKLMAMPSPDAAAFAFKYLVAHGGGRDADVYDPMLEQEAKCFAFGVMAAVPVSGEL